MARRGAAVAVGAALVACGGGERGPVSGPAAGSAAGFNVVLVTFDTVRADALGCYGDARAHTPVVDALASRGVRFTHALAPAPTTLPSHSTLMTGLEPPSHGVRNNGTFVLAAEHVTLAERLADAGYATGAVIGAFVLDARYGLAQGFAHYDDELESDGAAAGDGHFLQRSADRVTDRALAWLAGQGGERPFFLWVHYFDAHAPYQPPAAHAPDKGPIDPLEMFDPAVNRARYLGEIAFADAELGRLLDRLGSARRERTLVVFASDHGEGLGEHGEYTHSRLVYDATMRVPLILSSPALWSAPAVESARVVGLVDVLPTVLSLLGLPAQPGVQGLSLFESAADPSRTLYGESLVPLLNHGWAPLYTLRRVGDKFISAPRPEYFDVRADPKELRNLYGPGQPRALELQRALMQRQGGRPLHDVRELDLATDELQRLAQLGYSRSSGAASRAGTLDPKDMIATWAVLTNAQAYSSQGQHERALNELQRVLQLNPDDPFAWETAYLVHLRRGAKAEAEAAIARVVELNPTPEACVLLAALLLERGALDGFEAALATASAIDPAFGEIFLARGDRWFRAGEFERARAEYAKALELDPGRAGERARKGLALVAEQLKQR